MNSFESFFSDTAQSAISGTLVSGFAKLFHPETEEGSVETEQKIIRRTRLGERAGKNSAFVEADAMPQLLR